MYVFCHDKVNRGGLWSEDPPLAGTNNRLASVAEAGMFLEVNMADMKPKRHRETTNLLINVS